MMATSRNVRFFFAAIFGFSLGMFAQDRTAPAVSPGLTISSVSSAELKTGEKRQFLANAIGLRDLQVTWAVGGCAQADCGQISADGWYSAPFAVQKSLRVIISARTESSPCLAGSMSITVWPDFSRSSRTRCTSAQSAYCSVAWKVHQLVSPLVW